MKRKYSFAITLFLSVSISFAQKPVQPSLGFRSVKTLKINGLEFKDLNKNGKLDKYEDWRLADDIRAKDLASKLSVEQIAGLMLYSSHQSVPARSGGYFAGTYGGKPFKAGETDPSDLTDQIGRSHV